MMKRCQCMTKLNNDVMIGRRGKQPLPGREIHFDIRVWLDQSVHLMSQDNKYSTMFHVFDVDIPHVLHNIIHFFSLSRTAILLLSHSLQHHSSLHNVILLTFCKQYFYHTSHSSQHSPSPHTWGHMQEK